MKNKISSKRLEEWIKQVIAQSNDLKLGSADHKSLLEGLRRVNHGLKTGDLVEIRKGIDAIASVFMK